MQPGVVGPTVYTEPAPLLAPSPSDAFTASFLQSRAEEVCMQLTNEYEERLAVVSANLCTYVCVWLCVHTYIRTYSVCVCEDLTDFRRAIIPKCGIQLDKLTHPFNAHTCIASEL